MMSPHSTVHKIQRRILCLLLCVVSWNGPVPVLHIHECCLESSTLVEHLQKFHSDEGTFVLPNAAHWHFARLNELRGELAGEAGDNSHPTVLFFTALDSPNSVNYGADRLVYELAWDSASLERSSYGLRVFRNAPRSLLSSLLCAAPLVAITGVCLS